MRWSRRSQATRKAIVRGRPPAVLLVLAVLQVAAARADILEVGPGKRFAAPSDAARAARDGDTINIAAGEYRADVAVWRQDFLTIRGVGGLARLIADGRSAEDKAIWVIKGRNARIEGIEFVGARVRDRNGAGIRQEGTNLTVSYSRFVDNENGILTGDDAQSEILVEHTEFAANGAGDGYSHNLYVGRVRSFTMQYSYSHHARVGHQLKTRARENYILNNRLGDEQAGNSSYLIDLADGGLAYVIGNVLQQGPATENSSLVHYAAARGPVPREGLYLVNNTLVNERHAGVFVANRNARAAVYATNNLFVGKGTLLAGRGELRNNLRSTPEGFADAPGYDYRLTRYSPAIDAGSEPGTAHGYDLRPLFEYRHVARQAPRAIDETIDVGAHEYLE